MNNYLIIAKCEGFYAPYDAECWTNRANEYLSTLVFHDLDAAIAAAQKEATQIPGEYDNFITLSIIKFNYICDPDNPDAAPMIDYDESTEPIPDMINGWLKRDMLLKVSNPETDEVMWEYSLWDSGEFIPPGIIEFINDQFLYDRDNFKNFPNPHGGRLIIKIYDYHTDEIVIHGCYDAHEIKLFINVKY